MSREDEIREQFERWFDWQFGESFEASTNPQKSLLQIAFIYAYERGCSSLRERVKELEGEIATLKKQVQYWIACFDEDDEEAEQLDAELKSEYEKETT